MMMMMMMSYFSFHLPHYFSLLFSPFSLLTFVHIRLHFVRTSEINKYLCLVIFSLSHNTQESVCAPAVAAAAARRGRKMKSMLLGFQQPDQIHTAQVGYNQPASQTNTHCESHTVFPGYIHGMKQHKQPKQKLRSHGLLKQRFSQHTSASPSTIFSLFPFHSQ